MVIGLLAPFRRVLLTRGCQQDPCFVGDFLRVGLPLRPAKSLQGFVGWLTYAACHTGKWLKSSVERLSDKSLDGPQGFVLLVLKAAKMVFVGPF